ncbi:uncharacterized protein LOC113515863, partial [Galleria mellonella]|uniref:Uncharacterized protein LOC113515863 n=1 Tax=Galleria mellonella TaxID=7137 RepID=A0ABM3MUY8_GALME
LFPFGKVIKLFTAPGDDDGRECQPSGHAVARAGVCLNAYECHDRQGRASGECAKGLGVCCVFEVSCGDTVQNNLTYFMSPGFPDLWNGEEDCDITIHKVTEGIMQLRVDFVHFTIGQPNRTTGECDEDAMILGEGANNFTVCGQNHGQHLYYTLTNEREKRDTEELAGARGTRLRIRIRGSEMPRIWLLRLAQMPLAHSAPHDCLQWYRENNGTIKTFNYAVNGRHLSGHDYRACIRHNVGYCSVRYTPCDSRSFRIGSGGDQVQNTDPVSTVMSTEATGGMQEDEMEGSGADPNIASPMESAPQSQSFISMIWSFIWPSWLWGQSGRSFSGRAERWNTRPWDDKWSHNYPDLEIRDNEDRSRQDIMLWNGEEEEISREARSVQNAKNRVWDSSKWDLATFGWMRLSPYAQHFKKVDDKLRYYGYGNYGAGLKGYGRQRCQDRITIQCEDEYFVSSSLYSMPGVCDPHHCGDSFCPGIQFEHCRVETSVKPFKVSVHFGPPSRKSNPEDNIGACLKYTQLPCNV